MLDLSEEVDEENISICKSYIERMAPMKARENRGHGGKYSGFCRELLLLENLNTSGDERDVTRGQRGVSLLLASFTVPR